MNIEKKTLLICCGAIAREIVAMVEQNGWQHMHVQCLPAQLHNTPAKIPEALRAKIQASRSKFDDILVLYSDCGTGGLIDKVLREENVERIHGAHCYEVFAGSDAFAKLMDEEQGSFFLTGFLARNFERLVIKGLGLDKHPQFIKRCFRNYTRLVYLAQTQDRETMEMAEKAAQTLGLRFEVRHVGLGDYERFVSTHNVAAHNEER